MERDARDLLDVLISIDMSADYITGVFISMLFAGHHTSSGTSAWTLIELMRHPDVMAEVVAELDDLYADGSEISFQALRSIPRLESVIKETLRLHPPLIILMRQVVEEIELAGHTIPVGTIVASSPRVSNRLEEDFPDAQSFDPTRYRDPRQEDLQNRWTWIPFGAGKHRCVGNAFAMMQIKAIFSVLLQDFEFELVQPSETYRDDYSKMVIQLQRPCRARYRRRRRRWLTAQARWLAPQPACGVANGVIADLDVCQGHQMCQAEAPEVFGVRRGRRPGRAALEHPAEELRPQVQAAVRYCPAMALSIDGES